METVETLEIEIQGVYQASDLVDYFSFEDIRENTTTTSDGLKVTNSKIFMVSKVEPVTDNLSSDNTIMNTKITLTSGVSSLLQNDESGSLLTIQYAVEPVQPSNAAFVAVTYSSFMLHASISGLDSNGTPITFNRVSELNSTNYLENVENDKDYLVSDPLIIDGVYPKTVNNQLVNMHS
ncbi:hypothetical protein [Mycobacterium sp.]|uniref:hypothetical protein n=1 Tax=Mycobacterium sp. TaxID=1785 RepID=UPI003A84FD48